MKRNKRNYDKYISIMDETINVNWNFREQYEKIVDCIIEAYEKEKIQLHEETTEKSQEDTNKNAKRIGGVIHGKE